MPVRTPALFQIEESLPSIRGRRSPNLKAAGYERAKIVICKIPSFGEHRGDLQNRMQSIVGPLPGTQRARRARCLAAARLSAASP
jgi:hypothetical protein